MSTIWLIQDHHGKVDCNEFLDKSNKGYTAEIKACLIFNNLCMLFCPTTISGIMLFVLLFRRQVNTNMTAVLQGCPLCENEIGILR